MIPAITGLTTTEGVFDSTGLLSLSERPARLGILGGGYIGLEFASMFANFGTKVTIFEAAPQFLPREDRDIAQAIAHILQEKGVELILNAKVQAVSSQAGAVQVELPEGAHLVDALLVASGRKPATAGLQLHNAGVAVNERGGLSLTITCVPRQRISGRWAMLLVGYSLPIFHWMISASFVMACWVRVNAAPAIAKTCHILSL